MLSTYLQRMYDQMNLDLSTYVKDIWNWIFEFWCSTPLSVIFQQYIMATSFSGGGRRSTRREPSTMGKQLANFITCGCESSTPFLLFTKLGANPRRIGDRLVWVVKSNNVTHWATRAPEGHLKVCIWLCNEENQILSERLFCAIFNNMLILYMIIPISGRHVLLRSYWSPSAYL